MRGATLDNVTASAAASISSQTPSTPFLGHFTPPPSPFAGLANRTEHNASLPPPGSYSESTLVLANDSRLDGNFLPPRVLEPDAVAADPQDGTVLVANFNTSDVSVFNLTTHRLMAVVPVAGSPTSVLFDSLNDRAYVLSVRPDNLTVIQGSTNSVVGTVPVGPQTGSFGYPQLLALDPQSGLLFATDHAGQSISVVDTSNDTLLRVVPIQPTPVAVAYDPVDGDVYVADYSYNYTFGCSFVSILNGTTGSLVGQVPVGYYPDGLAVDPATGVVFVANLGSNNVSVVNGTEGPVVATIAVGTLPDALAFDNTSDQLFVVNGNYEKMFATGNVSIVSPLTYTVTKWIPVGSVPANVLVDPADDAVLVANAGGAGISLIDTSNNSSRGTLTVGPNPFAMAVIDALGDVAEANLGLVDLNASSLMILSENLTNVSAPLPVTNNPVWVLNDPENGQTYVTDFWTGQLLAFNSTTVTLVTSIFVPSSLGPLAFDPTNDEIFVAGSSGRNVTVINGSDDQITAVIGLAQGPGAMAVDVVTQRLFIVDQWADALYVVDIANNTVIENLFVGVNPVAVAVDPANDRVYVVAESLGYVYGYYFAGNLTVVDARSLEVLSTITLGPTPESLAIDTATGNVYVAETGSDNVTVVNTSTDQVVGNVTVGWQPYGMAVDPVTGDLYVASYESGNLSVFSPGVDAIVATIPTGESPNSVVLTDEGRQVVVTDVNSSYVTVLNATTFVTGYIPTGVGPREAAPIGDRGEVWVTNYDSGTISILSNISLPVAFPVTLTAVHVPVGVTWTGWVGQQSIAGTALSRTFWALNGSVPYYVRTLHDYVVTGLAPSGTLLISGAPIRLEFNVSLGHTYTLHFRLSPAFRPYYLGWCVEFVSLFTACSPYNAINFTNLTPSTYGYRVLVPPGFAIVIPSGFTLSPVTGNITIVHSNSVVRVHYHAVNTVTFTQTGLRAGQAWSLKIQGVWYRSTNATQQVVLLDGRYQFKVGFETGFSSKASPAVVKLDGSNVTISITFTPRPTRSGSEGGALPAGWLERTRPNERLGL